MIVEDPPPPPLGDTGELETLAIKVSRFTFNESRVGKKHVFSHPVTREPVFGLIYEVEIVQNMFNPPDDYIVHVEYER